MTTALVIGSEGQDGTLLSANLAAKGMRIIKIGRSAPLKPDTNYIQFDLADGDYKILADVIHISQPHEIYFLAAYHHSSQEDQSDLDFKSIDLSFKVNLTAFVNVLEIVKTYAKETKVFYASSSLIFSATDTAVQDEFTPHMPNSPYAFAKSAAMQVGKGYRENENLFVSTGILYNHESILRKDHFLSKKIINDTHRLLKGEISEIEIGDLSSVTDWGYAPDYVEGMYRILQQKEPGDYIIASGTAHKVEDWFHVLFGYLKKDWRQFVKENKSLLKRKKPVLVGNNSKLLNAGWKPAVSFEQMVINMFENRI